MKIKLELTEEEYNKFKEFKNKREKQENSEHSTLTIIAGILIIYYFGSLFAGAIWGKEYFALAIISSFVFTIMLRIFNRM